MRLFKDRPDVLTPGRWLWCPPGAKLIPYYHVFGTNYQESTQHKIDPPVGEVPVRLGWSDGKASPRYTGQHWCGNEDVWTHGALYSQRGTPSVDADGVPPCCNPLEADAGGLVIEGQSDFAMGGDTPGRGGVLLGGVAWTQGGITYRPRGGVLLGGIAETRPGPYVPTRGGVLLGGVAPTQQAAAVPIRGGVLLGGAAATNAAPNEQGRGGVLLGGGVSTQGPPVTTGGGGVLLGGVADTVGPPSELAIGGVLLGGLVVTSGTPSPESRGGVLLGGLADTIAPRFVTGAGGVLLGGIALTVGVNAGGGSGGVLLGGIADTEGGGGISTTCCPGVPTPMTLYFRSSGASDGSLNVDLTATYDGPLAGWRSGAFTFGICGTEWQLVCVPGRGWVWHGGAFAIIWDIDPTIIDCGPPLYLTFDPNFVDPVSGFSMNSGYSAVGCIGAGTGPNLIEVKGVPF